MSSTKLVKKSAKESYTRVSFDDVPQKVTKNFVAKLDHATRNFELDRVYVSKPFDVKGTKQTTYKSHILYHFPDDSWGRLYLSLPQMDCYQNYTYKYVKGKSPKEQKESGENPIGVQVSYKYSYLEEQDREFLEEVFNHVYDQNWLMGLYAYKNDMIPESIILPFGGGKSGKPTKEKLVKQLLPKKKDDGTGGDTLYLPIKSFFKEGEEPKFSTKYFDPPKKMKDGSVKENPVSVMKYMDGKFNVRPTLEILVNWCIAPASNITQRCFTKFEIKEALTGKSKNDFSSNRIGTDDREAEDDSDTEKIESVASKDVIDEVDSVLKNIKTTTKAPPPSKKIAPKATKISQETSKKVISKVKLPPPPSPSDSEEEEVVIKKPIPKKTTVVKAKMNKIVEEVDDDEEDEEVEDDEE